MNIDFQNEKNKVFEVWLCFDDENEYLYESKIGKFLIENIEPQKIGTNLINILNNSDLLLENMHKAKSKIHKNLIINSDIFLELENLKNISPFLAFVNKQYENYYIGYDNDMWNALNRRIDKIDDLAKRQEIENKLQNFDTEEEICKRRKKAAIEFLGKFEANIINFQKYFEIIQKIDGFDGNFRENFKNVNFDNLDEQKRKNLIDLFNFQQNIAIPESVITYGKLQNKKLTLFDSKKTVLNQGLANSSALLELYDSIRKGETKQIQRFNIKTIRDFFCVSLYMLTLHRQKINKCQICGKYFFVKSKANEKYCSNIYKNGKTCSKLAYEINLSQDKIKSLHRKVTKSANQYVSRNLKNKPYLPEKHKKWADAIKRQMQYAIDGQITFCDFKQWIKDNNNWKSK